MKHFGKAGLAAIILLGASLRYFNLTPYKIYPDTYVNLITALNISNYHSVVGFLGDKGMVYPDFFMWTRPAFALAVNFITWFTGDMDRSGMIVTFASSVLTLPLFYLLLRKIFNSEKTALAGTLAGAVSYNHTVWSGFIQTEAFSIFLMTAFLTLVFYNLKRKTAPAEFWDVLTGVVLGTAILARYEYILIVIPLFILLRQSAEQPWIKFLNIVSSAAFVLSVAASQLFPIPGAFRVFSDQSGSMIRLAALAILIIPVFLFFHTRLNKSGRSEFIRKGLLLAGSACWLLALFVIAGYFGFGESGIIVLNAYVDFFTSDFLISLLLLTGITYWMRDKKVYLPVAFALLTSALLAPVYYRVNPYMQRYLVHLLPFFLIIASYGIDRLLKSGFSVHLNKTTRNLALTAVLLPILIQSVSSFYGLRYHDNGAWTKNSFDEEVAGLFDRRSESYNMHPDDSLLVASFPEPYFYLTRMHTYSITDEYPYIYIDDSLNNLDVYLVQDMGMHDIFPSFSRFIDHKLQSFIIDEYLVGQDYRYGDYSRVEEYPTRVFKLTLRELKDIINSTQTRPE